ncbi:LysR family transcriptional regulator [Acidisoma cellulosilytica]|uniref:LysR family transcriptional regulator n=1 Tax=Acidisoma cellulosilyticum TaxID=2802395 RepID=A0A963Z329_9PROT|nr:LysR family transcriptional regulator [Acidisoma cellulosilyticum]MCB8881947.1 LysR family transcriptional regulator [Acidisoma cellulosilyticum]
MAADLNELSLFLAVAKAGGFRQAARGLNLSPSGLSEAVSRLESKLGLRLLHRSTRSLALTEAGQRLVARLAPALSEVEAAVEAAQESARHPAGTLRLNVPVSAARLVLPALVPPFLKAYPDIRLEITAEESFVDILAAGCDAGIRYDERLEQDMIALPIGPRRQRYAAGAAPDYLSRHGLPAHPRDLLAHACMRGRFPSGATDVWEFERGEEKLVVEPTGPLLVTIGPTTDLAVDAALGGLGIVYIFEDWIRPHFAAGRLLPVLEDWWPSFSGPFLYYSGRRLVPPPLRAFIDFVRAMG